MTPRHARAEAIAALRAAGVDLDARVLEPSPPALVDDGWLADDPVALDGADPDTTVRPVGDGVRWLDVAAGDETLAGFARRRWLGPYPTLGPVPDSYHGTRAGLHQLAFHVVYRARRAVTGKFGLRWTLDGFGTPFFGADEQIRVAGGQLVCQRADDVWSTPITSLAAAADVVGVELDPDFDHGFQDVLPLEDPDAELAIDGPAALAVGQWFGFGTSLLESLRHDLADRTPSRVQIWPEHFDAAMDLAWGGGSSQRVNLGASPGDGHHAEPYVYVGPWGPERPGDPSYWNAPFGAICPVSEVRSAGDGGAQRQRALDFFRRGVQLLEGSG